MQGLDLIVKRGALNEAELVPFAVPETPEDGTAILRIDKFALTANNITYAVAPDLMRYWEFFPVDREGWGRVPVWGFADVVASAHPEVAVGRRVYGYFPMSSHLVIRPTLVSAYTMTDATEHRQPMSPFYNQYSFTDQDPTWSAQGEAMISLFRPLFTTSFLLDDLHRSNGFFDAGCVILSSASSKTAMALAHLLAASGEVEVVGLTSAGNVGFVEGLGCYDRVLAYGDLESLPCEPTCFVDMAGNADLLRRVHEHLADDLKNSCRVGLTHWQSLKGELKGMPGPRPEFFFAPGYAQQRLTDWGRAAFLERTGAAWAQFVDTGVQWINVVEDTGPEAALARYTAMLGGEVDPAEGLILSLKPG